MRQFSRLCIDLEETGEASSSVPAIRAYFEAVPPVDAAWSVYFLAGGRIRGLADEKQMKTWAETLGDYPAWLVDSCFRAVGDWAETLALIIPKAANESERGFGDVIENTLLPLRDLDGHDRDAALSGAWDTLTDDERRIFNRILAGKLPVRVDRTHLAKGLAGAAGLNPAVVAHRLVGKWVPSADRFEKLMSPPGAADEIARNYPFCYPWRVDRDLGPEAFGRARDWRFEWMRGGLRAQLIKRRGGVLIWSDRDEDLTQKFSVVSTAAGFLPDGTALDGEILDAGRDTLRFEAFDCLEKARADIRMLPLADRLTALAEILSIVPGGLPLKSSAEVGVDSWTSLRKIRRSDMPDGVDGCRLRRKSDAYRSARSATAWWAWKPESLTTNAVLVYAHPETGRRGNKREEYTFAVWRGKNLVPVARMPLPADLDRLQCARLKNHVEKHTVDRFGPVRAVRPELVFELAFEGVSPSRRRKSGLVLRAL